MITPDYCEKLAATLKWAADDPRSGRPSWSLVRKDDVRAAGYLIDDLVAELRTLADFMGDVGAVATPLQCDTFLTTIERWRTP